MGIWYATREDVQSALDVATTARDVAQIDRELEAISRGIEGSLHRVFYPVLATRLFDFPRCSVNWIWRIRLGVSELVSTPTTVSVAGTVVAPSDYTLEPVNDGPPFSRVDIAVGKVTQPYPRKNAVSVAGLWGHSDVAAPAGALAASIDAVQTNPQVKDASVVGVGSLITIGTERMIVTGKAMLTTAQTLLVALSASNSDVLVQVANGSLFHAGEVILLDAERMLVIDVAGNNLVVKRAWDGTTLAAHSGSTIFAPRQLTVVRAAGNTTPATHNANDPITSWVVPGPVRDLAVAELLNRFEQERSAYARTVGAGESLRNASGAGLADIRAQAMASHGRSVLETVV